MNDLLMALYMHSPTQQDARTGWLQAPLRRAYAELHRLGLTLVFHNGNSHSRKLATIVVVAVWGSIELGAAFGYANLPGQFNVLRVFVGVLIGRMWGIEFQNFAGLELSYGNDGGGSGAGDDGGGDGGGDGGE